LLRGEDGWVGLRMRFVTVPGFVFRSGGADGGEEPGAGRQGADGQVGHQLRRPLHLVHGHLLPRRIRRLSVSLLFASSACPVRLDWIAALSFPWASYVTAIFLSLCWTCRQMANSDLSGTLSPSIGNLSHLQTM
jgi:hypothetical protein